MYLNEQAARHEAIEKYVIGKVVYALKKSLVRLVSLSWREDLFREYDENKFGKKKKEGEYLLSQNFPRRFCARETQGERNFHVPFLHILPFNVYMDTRRTRTWKLWQEHIDSQDDGVRSRIRLHPPVHV